MVARVSNGGMTPTPNKAVHVTRAGYITQDGSTLGIVAKVGRTWHYQAKRADGMFGPASEGFPTQSGAVTHLLAMRRIEAGR